MAKQTDSAKNADLENLYALTNLSPKNTLNSYFANVAQPYVLSLDPLRQFWISGTCGKGSTCNYLRALLQDAGHDTVLFTSPHLVHPRERIRVNGEPIPENLFYDLISQVKSDFDLSRLNFFEVMMLATFCLLKENPLNLKNDPWVIWESGVGARFDAVSVINARWAIITRIDYDHIKLLGPQIQDIAFHKAGVLRRGTQAWTLANQPEGVNAALKTHARHAGSTLTTVEPWPWQWDVQLQQGWPKTEVITPQGPFVFSLPGPVACENAALAWMAALGCGVGITSTAGSILACTRWEGRNEIVSTQPTIVLSGDHNPPGYRTLAQILEQASFRHLHFIVALSGDRKIEDLDALTVYSKLQNATDTVSGPRVSWHWVPAGFRSGEPPQRDSNWTTVSSRFADAFEKVRAILKKEDLVVVTGSLYLIGEARGYFATHPTKLLF